MGLLFVQKKGNWITQLKCHPPNLVVGDRLGTPSVLEVQAEQRDLVLEEHAGGG